MLYYERTGRGSPLLLLHSGGMAAQEWAPQVAILNKRHDLIMPDLPGHGRSPRLPEGPKIDGMGRAVIALLDELDIEQVHICGSSMGGAVGLWLTLNYPQRVRRLILYRMNYRKNQGTYAQTQAMSSPEYWQRFGLHKWLSELHTPQGGPQAWKRVIADVSAALDPKTSAHNHSLEDLTQIAIPVLLAVGDRDPVAPLDDVLDMYHAIPNAGLWIMPYASHITATNTWRSGAFAEEVLRFLARPMI